MYTHKSGAQKRKEKEDREKKASKGQLSLQRFFKPASATASESSTASTSDTGVVDINDRSPSPLSQTDQQIDNDDNVIAITATAGLVEVVGGGTGGPSRPTHETEIPCPGRDSSESFFDIGSPTFNIQIDLKKSHEKLPESFPVDHTGGVLPVSIFKKKLGNGEVVPRDWLVWSKTKEALYCLPCRLYSKLVSAQRSSLALPEGYSTARKWRKLHDKIPEHESSAAHKSCYVQWKAEQRRLRTETSLSDLLLKSVQHECQMWKEVLKRLLHVTLFIAERGLAFRGESNKIGDPCNGNFLGLLELVAIYDPILNEHLRKVRHSQETGTRLQVHYLSSDIQNEFISACAAEVINCILQEREEAKYFSIIVDATPDTAHVEQTAFLVRYVHCTKEGIYKIEERLLAFADCAQKTGEAITQLIISKLDFFKIPLADCRGQGYDNGSNMKGAYKGVQARIIAANSLAVFSACACHSLNLSGEHAAESCPAALTFFGAVQKLYVLFSSSPQRWEILQKKIGCSLHSSSETRWSARVESVKPFGAHLSKLSEALDELLNLNLSAECRRDVNGLLKYMRTLNCLVMASIWTKVLKAIDIVNKVLQARETTLDVVSKNLKNLIAELKVLRNEGWVQIWSESVTVARNIGWPDVLEEESKRIRKRKRMVDETDHEEEEGVERTAAVVKFKREVFYIILDEVIGDLTVRFKSTNELCEGFSVLWEFRTISEEDLETRATNLVVKYSTDLQESLLEEFRDLKSIFIANFGEENLQPLQLLTAIEQTNLTGLFPNICIALRIFVTIPGTSASAERAFSALKRVKNVLRSTMCQHRLSSLGVLAVETQLARNANLDRIIEDFAERKARKANIISK